MPARLDRAADRRSEPRTPAGGRVRLLSPDLRGRGIDGELMDLSPHGFRAAHACRELASGQTVLYEHAAASGRARVVWTRIAAERVESGFHYLDAGAGG